VVGALF
jgi:hypothetical protein